MEKSGKSCRILRLNNLMVPIVVIVIAVIASEIVSVVAFLLKPNHFQQQLPVSVVSSVLSSLLLLQLLLLLVKLSPVDDGPLS